MFCKYYKYILQILANINCRNVKLLTADCFPADRQHFRPCLPSFSKFSPLLFNNIISYLFNVSFHIFWCVISYLFYNIISYSFTSIILHFMFVHQHHLHFKFVKQHKISTPVTFALFWTAEVAHGMSSKKRFKHPLLHRLVTLFCWPVHIYVSESKCRNILLSLHFSGQQKLLTV